MQPEILVPLDGSRLAETALPHVVAYARAMGQPVMLLRSVGVGPDEEHLVTHAAMAQGRMYVGYLADQLRAMGLRVRTTVTEGAPISRILDHAAELHNVGLIAMATRSPRGMRRWLFGSVTEQVIQRAPVPVLAVRADAEAEPSLTSVAYRTIIVPVDGTAFAEQALAKAVPLAEATSSALHLLAVIPGQEDDLANLDGGSDGRGIVPLWMAAERDTYVRHMANYLSLKQKELCATGKRVHVELAYGAPPAVIVDVSRRHVASLLVMATHARSGFQRLWLGSVAQQALEHAEVPMLLVRGSERHESNSSRVGANEEAFVAGF